MHCNYYYSHVIPYVMCIEITPRHELQTRTDHVVLTSSSRQCYTLSGRYENGCGWRWRNELKGWKEGNIFCLCSHFHRCSRRRVWAGRLTPPHQVQPRRVYLQLHLKLTICRSLGGGGCGNPIPP